MKYTPSILEEELKHKVAEDFFAISGKIVQNGYSDLFEQNADNRK